MDNTLSKLKDIKYLIFDVDGVFTDSSLLVSENGDLLRKVNAKDGYAVKHALDKNYSIILITGGNSAGVKKRFQRLGVKHVYISVTNKLELLNKLHDEGVLDKSQALYMGDDIPDLDVMKAVAFPCCPKDAVPEIKDISYLVTSKNGGQACVREMIEAVLKVQDNWV